MRWPRLATLLLGLLLAAGPCLAAVQVVLVSSEAGGAYVEAVRSMRAELERAGLPAQDVVEFALADLPPEGRLSPRLFVALGTRAAATLAERDLQTPLLSTLLPRSAFERQARSSTRKPSLQVGLVLDQPAWRQIDLLHLAFPQAKRLGLMWGADSRVEAAELISAASSRALKPISPFVEADQPVFPALKRILEDADVLLAIADPQIYNSASLQNILLATFRARLPTLGFSAAYVRAGSVLGLYTTPTQIGLQAAALVRSMLAGRVSPALQFPTEFTIGVNEQVMRSLGLSLDAGQLTEALRKLEKDQ